MDGARPLRINLLGELTASCDGRPLDLGGRRQREVLAVLLLAHGEDVPAERLADAVWGERAPGDAVSARQSYVSHLRRRLQPGSPARARSTVIVREGPGYAVRQPPDAVDAWRFEALLGAADEATRPEKVASLLRESLDLWRGPALADYADEPWAAAEITRLSHLRSVARERLLTARLEIGEPALLVPELEALVGEEPLREERWRLLVVALYRAHRQADALGALRRARTTLAEELGVDPGPALRELEAQVLAQSPSLVLPRPRVGDEPAAPAVTARDQGRDGRPGPRGCSPDRGVGRPRGRSSRPAADRGPGRHRQDAAGGGGAATRGRTIGAHAVEPRKPAGEGLRLRRRPAALRARDGRPQGSRGADARCHGGSTWVFGVGDSDRADGFAVLHGLYWLAVNLATKGPLVLAVDDAQWCDGASLRFLAYLARRLETLPILILATIRTGEEPPEEDLLAELALEPEALVLRPTPLSVEATAELVERRLSAQPAPLFTAACHRTTSGNPLLLTQLLRALSGIPTAPGRPRRRTPLDLAKGRFLAVLRSPGSTPAGVTRTPWSRVPCPSRADANARPRMP